MNGCMYLFILFIILVSPAPGVNIQNADSTGATDQTDSLSFLPIGTIISSRQGNEIICFLPGDTEVQGLLCHGHKHDWQTVFYTNGQLSLAWLVRDQVIQGIPCKAASFGSEILRGIFGSAALRFHINGQIARCKLARDFMIGGHKYKEGDILHFDRHGGLLADTPKNKSATKH